MAKQLLTLICETCGKKFKGYKGTRMLLIDISQPGLDWEFHAQRFKDSQGILLIWIKELAEVLTNVDFIYLEPGVRLWQASNMHRVLAGHKYVDNGAGHYICLWHRQSAATKPLTSHGKGKWSYLETHIVAYANKGRSN